MAKKHYSTTVVGIGSQVSTLFSAGKMLILLDDSMVLPEVRNMSIHHSGNHVNDVIKPGNVLKINNSEFKIIKVGSDVQSNLKNLGHTVIKFDNGKGDLMEGSIHVEDKPIPKIQVGDEISVVEGTDDLLKGKTATIISQDNSIGESISQLLRDNGVTIVVDKNKADIVVEVK